MDIDYKNQDPETLISAIIANQEFCTSPVTAENFNSKEFVRKMTDRDKALFTIISQIETEKNLHLLALENVLEQELLENYSDHFKKMHCNELAQNGINSYRNFIFCSNGDIYYISFEEAKDHCKFCDMYNTCAESSHS